MKILNRLIAFCAVVALCLTAASSASAQQDNPVRWSISVKMTSAKAGVVTIKVAIDKGWHLYGIDMSDEGPRPTEISLDKSTGVKFTGKLTPSRKPISNYDEMFGAQLSWWDADVTFTRKFVVTDPKTAKIEGSASFMACNDVNCRPPQTIELKAAIPAKKKK